MLQQLFKITKIETSTGDYLIQINGDEDNWYEFQKMRWCKKPIIDYPVFIIMSKAIPVEKHDAIIDNKLHLVTILDTKDDNHIKVESVTTGGTYNIKTEDLRPIIK